MKSLTIRNFKRNAKTGEYNIKTKRPGIIIVYGNRCPSCIALNEMVWEFFVRYKSKVNFQILDVSNLPLRVILAEHEITKIPAMFHYDKTGRLIKFESKHYLQDKGEIEDLVYQIVSSK